MQLCRESLYFDFNEIPLTELFNSSELVKIKGGFPLICSKGILKIIFYIIIKM